MANISEMRQALYSEYPNPRWKKKVDKMTDVQIIAVFRTIQERKKKKELETQQPSLFNNNEGKIVENADGVIIYQSKYQT